MNQINPQLRPLFNKSKQAAKVELVIQPGDELAVSADVAAQLGAQFAPVGDTSKADAATARAAAAEATSPEEPAPPTSEPEADAPAKKAAPKKSKD